MPDAQTIVSWLSGLPEFGVYSFLAFSSIVENVFPPWPGDTFTVFGGFLLALGSVRPVGTMVSLIVGNLIGAFTMYYAGAHVIMGLRRLEKRITRPALIKSSLREITDRKMIRKARIWFNRWGYAFVLLSRFSAGIRFFVSILAGISRMNRLLFALFFSLGVVLWNTLLLSGGYLLGNQWGKIMAWLRIYNIVVILLILLVGIGLLIFRFYRRRDDEME